MRNRILSRLVSLSTAALFAAGSMVGGGQKIFCLQTPVYGAVLEMEEPEITIKQNAAWTEEEQFKGELSVEISGLSEWLKAQEQKPEEEEAKEEIAESVADPSEQQQEETDEETPEKTEAKEHTEDSAEMPEESETKPEGTSENFEDIGENTEETEKTGEEITIDDNEAENPESLEEEPENEEYPEKKSTEEGKTDFMASRQKHGLPASCLVWESRSDALEGRCYNQDRQLYTEKQSDSPEDNADEIKNMLLVTRISQYFQVDKELLPDTCEIQELVFPGQNGQPEPGTEIKYPISSDAVDEQPLIIKIPITLKEEFCCTESEAIFPVLSPPVSDEPDQEEEEKEQKRYQGTCLAIVRDGEQEIFAQTEEMVSLNKPPTPADYTISVKTDPETPKAGQILTYHIIIANTGKQPLPMIALKSSLSPSGLSGRWYPDQNAEIDASGSEAIFANLGAGETCRFCYQVKLPESLAEPVINTITARAQTVAEPGKMLVRGTSLKTMVTALKADFSVSKSANRTSAAPGDTITYQICIRNTGERTLHSVLSTERFQAENIIAQFVEKDGVILNKTKTQALISQIPPGEVFSLEATVTLPENLSSKELINQVLVRTKETGEKSLQSEAGVKILGISPAPFPTWPSGGDGENEIQNGDASAVLDHPKTSDDSSPAVWAVILGLAGLLLVSILGYQRYRRSQFD